MKWEKISKKSNMSNSMQDNMISVYKDGRIMLSDNLYKESGSPEVVEIFIDKEQKVIGLKPTDINNPDAYKLQHNKNTSGPIIRITRIFKILGFNEIPSGRKNSSWDQNEGMIIFAPDNSD